MTIDASNAATPRKGSGLTGTRVAASWPATWVYCALSLHLLLGCGAEDATGGAKRAAPNADGNRPPVINSLRFEPAIPLSGERIAVSVDASDPDGDELAFVYRWTRNGAPMPSMVWLDDSGRRGILPRVASRGEVIEVMVIASDGQLESDSLRVQAPVGNRAPEVVEVKLSPSPTATLSDTLRARAKGWDADEDELTFRYAWQVNDREVDFHGASLPRNHYQRGDKIRVAVSASDGSERSAASSSGVVRIVNTAPRFTSQVPPFGSDGVFRYRPRIEDADGDRNFRYRLLERPKGMSINLANGSIHWEPMENQAGLHTLRVEADDRNGGRAEQLIDLHVAFEEVPSPAAKAR